MALYRSGRRGEPARRGLPCGIYAHNGPFDYSPFVVWGEVKLWGRVIQHEKGYRAEFAYPGRLYCCHRELAKLITRDYGVRVIFVGGPDPVSTYGDMSTFFMLDAQADMIETIRRRSQDIQAMVESYKKVTEAMREHRDPSAASQNPKAHGRRVAGEALLISWR